MYRSAIQAVIYADHIQVDEEKIQTGAVHVNFTKSSLLLDVMPKIEEMWMQGELPKGDSRCVDSPPSTRMVMEAINSMRTTFGADIHYASDNGKWCKPLI